MRDRYGMLGRCLDSCMTSNNKELLVVIRTLRKIERTKWLTLCGIPTNPKIDEDMA